MSLKRRDPHPGRGSRENCDAGKKLLPAPFGFRVVGALISGLAQPVARWQDRIVSRHCKIL